MDDRGIMDALQTYVLRHPELQDPQFYGFVPPFASEAPKRICFRRLSAAPTSLLIAASTPRRALKAARVKIVRDGAEDDEALFTQDPPGKTAVIYASVPARHHYNITAVFNKGAGPSHSQSTFADLPLAEIVEFDSP